MSGEVNCRTCKHVIGSDPCVTCGLVFENWELGNQPSAQQIGGNHYVSKSVQPWDAMAAWMTPEQFKGFLRGNCIKYLARCDDKGGVEDLKKARHYLDKLIEVLDKKG